MKDRSISVSKRARPFRQRNQFSNSQHDGTVQNLFGEVEVMRRDKDDTAGGFQRAQPANQRPS